MARLSIKRSISDVSTLADAIAPSDALYVGAEDDYKIQLVGDSAMIQLYLDRGKHDLSITKITTTGDAAIDANDAVAVYY
jgi:hypothetical protein